ncbi:MAG: ATP-binding protein, partial [Chloroflexi bacterium]|nr:ATP-binding protein [Chloroflexota bacterium]
MSINPYIAGNPIGDDAGFYGRRDILRDVNQVLSHPQKNAIVLYGQRRIGKTSVLMQLERQLAEADRYTPVYFDLMDRAGKPLSVVLWELTRRISLTLNQPPPPREMFDEEGLYFRDTFLPDAAARAADGGLVLLFDEFDVLDGPTQEQAGAAFFPYLRSWMAQAAGVQFVFVIGRRPEDLSTHTISTFKGVKATHVGLLAQKEAQKVIRLAEENGSLHWPADAVATVWNWTKGHPFFTQLLCETIWNQAYEDEEAEDELPTVSPDLVTESLEPAMAAGANAFVWLWDGLPPAERVVMAAIAEAETELITGDDLVEIL